jgi:type III restriction enzyme
MEIIDKLVISSPYVEPQEYWDFDETKLKFFRSVGRRPAGYKVSSNKKEVNDPGIFIPIDLVNKIRPRIKKWKEAGYPGVTGITKILLNYWQDKEEYGRRRFFFCQIEAIETLIWLTEGPESEKVGIEIKGDGGPFDRVCSKLATGTGKTLVMAMTIAWQVLNKINSPKDSRFSKNVFVIAPGLTVKSRLGVLGPDHIDNYYEQYGIVPPDLMQKLRQGNIIIENRHVLQWEDDSRVLKRKSVDKRGAKSDAAYVREILGDIGKSKSPIVVLNDEAHHAWRVPAELKVRKPQGVTKEELEEATKWVEGLDRIHRALGNGILKCFDFSATPYAPTGKKSSEEALFSWIVSDFGLNDAIESGLVKTPRVVVRDDGTIDPKTYKSKLYHIYDNEEVKADLNSPVTAQTPLPDLVRNAYMLLGADWLETKREWDKDPNTQVPPVMISVVNRTETSARIKHAFDTKSIDIEELCDPEKTLQIDSVIMKYLDDGDSAKGRKKELGEELREKVDSVGKLGGKGEQIQHLVSVMMLSEGWNCQTVTHIMGLRAFSSQLLCEQTIGRGLRRTSYEAYIDEETGLEMFHPEYVNVFGVPFTFLPHEGDGGTRKGPSNKKAIFPELERKNFEIQWPNIERVDHVLYPQLKINWKDVPDLEIDTSQMIEEATLASVLDGKPDIDKITYVNLEPLVGSLRLQTIIFKSSKEIYEYLNPEWKNRVNAEVGLAQVIKITEEFIHSGKIKIKNSGEFEEEVFEEENFRKKVILALSKNKIIQYLYEFITFHSSERLEPKFNTSQPVRTTSDARVWWTSKPVDRFKKTHMNLLVSDSTWETALARECDKSKYVEAWVKNDHLGFEILYMYKGVIRKYIPDFLIRLSNQSHLIIEVKGQVTDKDKTKWRYLDQWVQAANISRGSISPWMWAVSQDGAAADFNSIIEKAFESRGKVTALTGLP